MHTAQHTIDALNRLLLLHEYSLATYLSNFAPWTPHDEQHAKARQTLEAIEADHRAIVAHLAEVIDDREARVARGGYPMTYTDLHDLSLDFLLAELARFQRLDLLEIERIYRSIHEDPQAKRIAEQALMTARKHLAQLEELLPRLAHKPTPAGA